MFTRMWIVKPRRSLMLRSTKLTQADEGEFESVFDVDSFKYQMITDQVQVRCHTGHEDVQELCVLWLRLSGEEGGCSICFFVVRFSRNYCGNLATTAKNAQFSRQASVQTWKCYDFKCVENVFKTIIWF